MSKILSKPYIWYDQYLFPRIKNQRGATRLLQWLQKLSQVGLKKISREPAPLQKLDWRNVLILDACRHDTFEEVYGPSGSRISVGSMSGEFIEKTFSNHDFSDTVCITANPYYHDSQFKPRAGREVEDVFHDVYPLYLTDWNEEKQTVIAEDVVKATKKAEEDYPEKRKLVHFMQPHIPFVEDNPSDFSFREAILDASEGDKLWDIAMKGEIDREKVRKGYRRNLEYVLPFAEELADFLPGKTMVTSDHGTFLGENGLYKHPRGSNARALREVPWEEF
ncbi:MAG: hypothetical protein ABEJ83_00770 [Candidatus Nanohaloarchaea archaeon]